MVKKFLAFVLAGKNLKLKFTTLLVTLRHVSDITSFPLTAGNLIWMLQAQKISITRHNAQTSCSRRSFHLQKTDKGLQLYNTLSQRFEGRDPFWRVSLLRKLKKPDIVFNYLEKEKYGETPCLVEEWKEMREYGQERNIYFGGINNITC